MTQTCRIVMVQLRNRVGDIAANVKEIEARYQEAVKEHQADLVVFPELAVTGYPPEDLLLRPDVHRQVTAAMHSLAAVTASVPMVVGYPEKCAAGLYNAAALLVAGQQQQTWRKSCLPNYGVFDELRYFVPPKQTEIPLCTVQGIRFGCLICEDIWRPEPIQRLVDQGAELVVVLNASPFHHSKALQRFDLLCNRAKVAGLPLLYVQTVGGQDELIFDGGSMAVAAAGTVAVQGPYFAPALVAVDLEVQCGQLQPKPQPFPPLPSEAALIYQALVLGTRDYVQQNGFAGALVGASGGIDSALTLAIACDALGADAVQAVIMPSEYSAPESAEYARQQANTLGVACVTVPIQHLFAEFTQALAPQFADLPTDVTEENLQARIRGTLLMAMANKWGKIVLTTGNKSEMAMGYATLYGDMAGGFAVLRDVYKTWVYRLADYRNSIGLAIPAAVIARPPTAELRANQLDSDSLPPYAELDAILAAHIETDAGLSELVEQGFDSATVRRVVQAVARNEYKRRQAPPGVRVSGRAFGRDRRYPITSGYFKNL